MDSLYLIHFFFAAIFRFLEGIGSAFCFLGTFKIASNWFYQRRMAFVTGVIITIGMMGGIIAQTPLTILVESIGWRQALLLDAILGLFLAVIIFIIVEDCPENQQKNNKLDRLASYWQGTHLAYLSLHNWCCGLYTSLLNLPLVLLGALWGSLYLEQALDFSRYHASIIITMIFVGTILGSPIIGFISDYLGKTKLLMLVCILLSIIVSLLLICMPTISYHKAIILFFLLGLFSSAQILGYPAAAEINSNYVSGRSTSVVSFVTMSGYIVFQPLFGWIMDIKSQPIFIGSQPFYPLENYRLALFIIPGGLIIAFLSTMFIKTNFDCK